VGPIAITDVGQDMTQHVDSAIAAAPGSGERQLLLPGEAVSVRIICHIAADGMEVTRFV